MNVSFAGKTSGSKIVGWAKRELTPNFVKAFQEYRKEKKDILETQMQDAQRSVVSKVAKEKLFRTLLVSIVVKPILAESIYYACSETYGVSARDTSLSFNAQGAWSNTSSLSMKVAGGLVGLIPASAQETVSHFIIPAEVALSAVRIYVEQKVWKKLGITPDPLGTLLTPYVAGAMEMAYKATVSYPDDPQARNMVGAIGIYGNLVRMANAGVLYLAGKLIKDSMDGIKKNAM